MTFQSVIDRQYAISNGEYIDIDMPRFQKYAVCNLRGGIGKTTLVFNLSYLTDDLLVVDTCPQCNLSYFFDNSYLATHAVTTHGLILPYIVPSIGGRATHAARRINVTNGFFEKKTSCFIQSKNDLYLLPSQLTTAINQAMSLDAATRERTVNTIIFSLKTEIDREIQEQRLNKCLIDTSPFFSGATQLSMYAADALVVPVRTDQQSVNSFELLISLLTDPQSEFRKYLTNGYALTLPKIQMVVLTHCSWSRQSGDRNIPDRQTKMYAQRVYDIMRQHSGLLSTNNPSNHLFLLEDFLGSGRISSAQSKPIDLLHAGETKESVYLNIPFSLFCSV